MNRPASQPRLLIVDDEAAHMRALCETLGSEGFDTTGCTGAQEALRALEGGSFDLLLTDLNMPGMDGIALLRSALAVDPLLIGIIMTGEGTISTAVQAMQSGALDYILKPFKLSGALPVLTRALKVRELRLRNAALEAQVSRQLLELESSNRDLEAFAYSVSHDLRGPLQVIDGFSLMLTERLHGRLDATSEHYMARIRAGVSRMGLLVDGMLSLARVARQPLGDRPADMAGLATSVIEDLVQAGSAQPHWFAVQPALPAARGDAVLLRQVLANLLSNAAKFTAGSPAPLIVIGSQDHGGSQAWFVRDNGAGFDMAHAARLFEPFQRFHNERDFAGTGIGLSIVHRIVSRHGGRIWCETAPGQGACFFFTLNEAGRPPLQNPPPAPKTPG